MGRTSVDCGAALVVVLLAELSEDAAHRSPGTMVRPDPLGADAFELDYLMRFQPQAFPSLGIAGPIGATGPAGPTGATGPLGIVGPKDWRFLPHIPVLTGPLRLKAEAAVKDMGYPVVPYTCFEDIQPILFRVLLGGCSKFFVINLTPWMPPFLPECRFIEYYCDYATDRKLLYSIEEVYLVHPEGKPNGGKSIMSGYSFINIFLNRGYLQCV